MTRLFTKIVNGTSWALASKIVGTMAGLLISALLARLMTAGDLGAFFVMFNLITVLATVVQLGVGQALVRLIPEAVSYGNLNRIKALVKLTLWLFSLTNLITAVVLWGGVGSWLAREVFHSSAMANAFGLAVIWMMVYATMQFLTEIFRAFQNYRQIALCGLPMSNTILCLLLGVLYFFKGHADLRLVLSLCLVAGAPVIIMGLAFLRNVEAMKIHEDTPAVLRDILPISVPIMLSSLFFLLMARADIWIAGYYLSGPDVALYGVAARLAHFLSTPLIIINYFLPPLIAEMYAQGRTKTIEHLLRSITTIATLPVALGFVLCLVTGRSILTMVFGAAYADADLYLSILAVGQLVHVAAGPCGNLLLMTGFQRNVMTITFLCTLLFAVTAIIGGRYWGGEGIALAFSSCLSLQNLFCLSVAVRKVGIRSHLTTKPIRRLDGIFRQREGRFA